MKLKSSSLYTFSLSGGAVGVSTAKDIFLDEINNENGEFKDVSVDASSISLVGEILRVCYTYYDVMLIGSDGTYKLLYYFWVYFLVPHKMYPKWNTISVIVVCGFVPHEASSVQKNGPLLSGIQLFMSLQCVVSGAT